MTLARRAGLTGTKLVIVIVLAVVGGLALIGGIVAAITIPRLRKERIESNEISAVGTLKSLCVSQEQFKSQTIIDCDGDGTGEYGYFQELSGTSKSRSDGGLAGHRVDPSFMAITFGITAAEAGGIANKSGYCFLIFLPGSAAPPVRESVPVPNGDAAQANCQETRWVCYAWPTSAGTSGNRCFVINQEGQVYQAPNAGPLYDGTSRPMASGNAAYAKKEGNLDGPVVIGGTAACDGQIWTPVGG